MQSVPTPVCEEQRESRRDTHAHRRRRRSRRPDRFGLGITLLIAGCVLTRLVDLWIFLTAVLPELLETNALLIFFGNLLFSLALLVPILQRHNWARIAAALLSFYMGIQYIAALVGVINMAKGFGPFGATGIAKIAFFAIAYTANFLILISPPVRKLTERRWK